MPHFNIDNELNLVFGHGDLVVSTVYNEDGDAPIGIAVEGNKYIDAVGSQFRGEVSQLMPLLFMKFDNIESLDVVLGRLDLLRDLMLQRKNKA